MDEYLQYLLNALGFERKDAAYTAALAQQLEFVRSTVYEVKYPTLKARQFIPVDNSVNPGAETVSYYQWDMTGMADVLANYAQDLPIVSALAEKFTNPVLGLGEAYDWSVQDLRRSAFSGQNLEDKKAMAVRKGMELRIDDIAAVGYPKGKLKGFLNNANITILAAASDGTSARWVGGRDTPKAPDLIKADMFAAVNSIWVTSKQIFEPDTVLLSTQEFGHVSQTQTLPTSDVTLLRSFLANNPAIKNVDSWYKLDTADAAGTGPRMVTYARSSEVLELVIPQEFEQFPPQVKNLTFMVPCHARVGGVVIRYPLAIVYTDGI
jgi:hypothetical protein